MSDDKVDPSKKDPQISSADDLVKTSKKSDVELSEEELKRVSGGGSIPDHSLEAKVVFKYDPKT